MKREAAVPGFRPGRAPRQLVEKRFRKQVAEQVKSTLLMAALEQLDEDYKLNPITQPDLDVDAIELPDEGPMRFEMDVEVRPDFAAARLQGADGQAAGQDDHRRRRRRAAQARSSNATPSSSPSSKGAPSSATSSRPTCGSTATARRSTRPRRSSSGSSPSCGSRTARCPTSARPWSASSPARAARPTPRSAPARPTRASAARRSGSTFQVHDLKQLRLPEVNAAFLDAIGFDTEDELRDGPPRDPRTPAGDRSSGRRSAARSCRA